MQTANKKSKQDKIPPVDEFFKLFASAGLKERILFTLAIIVIYRIGVHIPIPGVDPGAFTKHPELAQSLLGMYDLFTGGALNRLSIFSMGIGPYITSSIIMQMMCYIVPKLEELQKHSGEQGRKQIQQYTRMGTIFFASVQSFTLVNLLGKIHNPDLVLTPGIPFLIVSTILLTASAVLIMWFGEQITEKGVGNGASLLIFLGISARIPVMVKNTYDAVQTGQSPTWGVVLMIATLLLLAALVVCLQLGQRKIAIVGSKRVVGNQMYVGDNYLPLPVNPSGVMAIIFASSTFMFPTTVMSFMGKNNADPWAGVYYLFSNIPGVGKIYAGFCHLPVIQAIWGFICQETINTFSYSKPEYSIAYFLLILFFAFFYASMILPVRDMAENLRRSGSAIQGIRPGKPTSDFLEATLNKLIFIGATSVAIIAILPIHVEQFTYIQTLRGLGSTSLIILVGVAIDTQKQILTHALSAQYQARGLFKAPSTKET